MVLRTVLLFEQQNASDFELRQTPHISHYSKASFGFSVRVMDIIATVTHTIYIYVYIPMCIYIYIFVGVHAGVGECGCVFICVILIFISTAMSNFFNFMVLLLILVEAAMPTASSVPTLGELRYAIWMRPKEHRCGGQDVSALTRAVTDFCEWHIISYQIFST